VHGDRMRHRAILAGLLALVLAVVLGGPGCAAGSSVESGDDGGGDVAATEAGSDAGTCAAPKTMCGGSCVNLGNDPKNCGQCGAACGMFQVCNGGTCDYSCSPPQTLCGGPSEAGAPDASGGDDAAEAGAGSSDAAAADAAPSGDGGAGDGGAGDGGAGDGGAGDGGATQPYCADLGNDSDNCGKCGNVCKPMHTCHGGACGLDCPPGEVACIAGDVCIPSGTCCDSAQCPISGEICPMPGGTCQCPGGERACNATGSCISVNDCCTQQDCTVVGSMCVTPGQPCQCGNGQKACSATNSCIPQTDCCTPADCGAPGSNNVQTYTCTAGMCGIGACEPGCYNDDGQYANGCECCDDALGKSCGAPTGLGQLSLGQTVTQTGLLPGPNESDWLQVTFSNEGNKAFHGHIYFTANPNGEFAFDVDSNCSPAPLPCGDGGSCTGKTAWEVFYGAQATGNPGDPNWQPIAPIGTVYVRVYRVSGSPTCDQYTLAVSE
jgi:hypothetical protein